MLSGICVIDFTQYLPGPFAALRLADRGAEVIKVESLTGDPSRAMGEGVFSANNRNKKSIAINLKDSDGTKLALELIKNADVVIESFRPGVMRRLGLDYDRVKAYNEKIIYVSLTGFGQEGEWARLGSHDLNYLALSGVLDQFQNDEGCPVQPSLTMADLIGGMACSEAIMAALFQRERSGKGTHIDLSIMDALFSMMATHVRLAAVSGDQHGLPFLNGSALNYHLYETKDHRYMSLGALEFKFWKNFCCAVERPEWVDAYPDKLSITEPLFLTLKQLFLTRTQKEWTKLGESADCCLFPVLNVKEAASSSYIMQRRLVHRFEQMPYVSTYQANKDLPTPPHGVPETGEHTEELLQGLLGKNKRQIKEWRERGVIL